MSRELPGKKVLTFFNNKSEIICKERYSKDICHITLDTMQ